MTINLLQKGGEMKIAALLDDLAKKYKEETITEEEKNIFYENLKAVIKSRSDIVNSSMADYLGMEYDDLLQELIAKTIEDIKDYDPAYSFSHFVISRLRGYIGNLIQKFHYKAEELKKAMEQIVDNIFEAGGSEEEEGQGKGLLYREILEKPLELEDIIKYQDLSERIEKRLRDKDMVSYEIYLKRLEGYNDYEIADLLGISRMKVLRKRYDIIQPIVEEEFRR